MTMFTINSQYKLNQYNNNSQFMRVMERSFAS